ncbi:tripartite ATP-independent transporter solute receptor, DctP family [Halomonas shengliensis]|uniref:Tripartite ATP-independent transporter solute receptor, DctP family n=1 Tax=Halomonas shengliensis TaxID=419597 RepID=A0A1H0CTI0_9GAMM|nr:TRAP transporter substrate-binding protein [Halomonas shengliensis]SDN61196.1 tripartite ATP-independent transporter solute receptor, DctP family [Halomonas shengliensis]
MIRTTNLITAGAVAAFGLTAWSGVATAADSHTIKFGNVISAGDTQNQGYELFAEQVAEGTDGRITVEVYPDGQLGGEREMIEATQFGDIEMTAPSVGVLANFDKSLEVFDFPFIFEDADTAHEVLDSELGDEMLAGLADSGLIALGWGENGFRNLAMTDGTVRVPEDMEGIKLRTMQVPMHIAYWESIGAAPTPISFPEVFTSLQQGVVDGVENPYELLYSARLTEPANYLTETRHIYDPEVLLINKDFYESLSEEDQEVIQSAADAAIDKIRSLKKTVSDEIRAEIEAEGGTVTDLTEEERQAWIDSAVPFYADNASEVDTEKLKAILEAAGNATFLEAIQ